MLCDTSCNREQTLEVDGVPVEFSLAKDGTKVSMHALHALLYLVLQPNSWETMVTSHAPDNFAVRETSFLTSSLSFQRQTSPKGGKQ